MTTLSPLHFNFKSTTDDILDFQSSVSVTQEGEFRLTFPEELFDSVNEVIREDKTSSAYCGRNSKRTPYIGGTILLDCKETIKAAGENYMSCTIKEEPVILYAIANDISYMKAPSGEIFPNGKFKEACYGKGGTWCGNLNAGSTKEKYSIGFVAICRIKTIYIRNSGQKVEYHIDYEEKTRGEYWDKLNSFCGITYNKTGFKELSYTEETAKFFYNTMLSMCYLADRIEGFFSDEEMLLNAIEKDLPLITS